MSTEQTGTTGNFNKRKYTKINFKEIWCSYEKHCDYKSILSDNIDICSICKYRVTFNIPEIIKKNQRK
jgi:hypothetical protein